MTDFYVYMYLRSYDSKNGAAGSPYYVGKGKGFRAYDKQHRCKPPSDRSKIIFVATGMSEPNAHQLEIFLIHIYGRIDRKSGCLANLTDGGEGQTGAIQTPESIEKRIAHLRGIPRSKEVKEKIRLGSLGKKRSEETRKRIGDSKRGCTIPRDAVEKRAAMRRGVSRPPFSEDWKNRISVANKGQKKPPRSEEYRANIRAARLRYLESKRTIL